ncbi:hypothetical protein [Chelatococcus asaccharovorans]|uniref:hypothetical protein n=1 Tax=Chelatococcus asaccharovorans TaxID=28210 RepID=UPI0011B427A7|nr:hypothetical protein [Chelatococcus asaccharovorans]MBS7706006.1 hypothetical protein [Chelatococcus asaccharovorans]
MTSADLLALLKGRPDLLAGLVAGLKKKGAPTAQPAEAEDAGAVPAPSGEPAAPAPDKGAAVPVGLREGAVKVIAAPPPSQEPAAPVRIEQAPAPVGPKEGTVTVVTAPSASEEPAAPVRVEQAPAPVGPKEGTVTVVTAPSASEEPAAPVRVEQAPAPVGPKEGTVTVVTAPSASEEPAAPAPREEAVVSVASEDGAAPVIVAPPPSEEPAAPAPGEEAVVSVASEDEAAPVIVAPPPSEEPAAPAPGEDTAVTVVPEEEEAVTATSAPQPEEEPAAPPPGGGAAAVTPDEEEAAMAAMDSQSAEVAAPAAPRPFKIVSTCCSNDFITLDASTSGSVDLGAGRDAVALPGNKVDYKVARQDGGWTVSHDVDGAKVTISLRGVEWLQFDDGIVCLDMADSNAITGYQIVKAVLGVPRDLNRVFSVAGDLDHGQSQGTVISELMHVMQSQFKGRFSAPHYTQDGITQHYENVLSREPDACGLTAWLKVASHMTPERMLASFALGPEATATAVREVGQGAPFEPTLFV